MNIFLSFIKRIVIIFASLLLFAAAYFFLYLRGDKSELPDIPFVGKITSTVIDISSSEVEIAQLQKHLSTLKGVSIDSDFFKSNVFKSLEDFRQPLPELKQGRDNPFAPIGEDI